MVRKKEIKKEITISTKKLYQYIITSLRYAYTRNNHLTPSIEYTDTVNNIKEILKVDTELGIKTIQQVIEECISEQLNVNFKDGLDDVYGNLKITFDFIDDLFNILKEYNYNFWIPYNYDKFNEIKLNYINKNYSLYKLSSMIEDKQALNYNNKKDLIKKGNIQEIEDYLFNDLLKEKNEKIVYRRINLNYNNKIIGYQIDVCTPIKHSGKCFLVRLNKYKD